MKPIYIPRHENAKESADKFFEILMGLEWLEVKQARKELFMSTEERTYRYGDMNYEYRSVPFHRNVLALMIILNQTYNCDLNVCFLNRYDNERHALGWHQDNSPEVDQTNPIIVVSFGAERELWVKEVGYKGEIPKEDRYLLEHGSVFVMPPGMQETHFHKIPKHSAPCSTRISLTFRRYK